MITSATDSQDRSMAGTRAAASAPAQPGSERCLPSLAPIEAPSGYPPVFNPATLSILRHGLLDESLPRQMAASYITTLGLCGEWLNLTGRAGPGRTWCLSMLDLSTARGFAAYVKSTQSKSRADFARYTLRWSYEQGLAQRAPGYSKKVADAVAKIQPRTLDVDVDRGTVPTFSLPAAPGLPPIPLEFTCQGKQVSISGLEMKCAGERQLGSLGRIIRPAGRPSALTPRAQHQVLLYLVREIQNGTWSRYQIVNAIDYFLRWLAHHPEWQIAAESFAWSNLVPGLANEYYDAVRDDPKGRDWWTRLRSFYRRGNEEYEEFTDEVWRELARIGPGTALSYDVRLPISSIQSRFVADPQLPPIQSEFRTRDQKYTVQTTPALWVQCDKHGREHGEKVNLLLLDDPRGGRQEAIFCQRLLHLIRLFLAHQASEEWAWGTVSGFVDTARGLQAWLWTHREMEPESFGAEHFTHSILAAYKNHLEGDDGPGYSASLSLVRIFYRWGVESRLPGFDREVAGRIDELPFTNAPRGELVRAVDPKQGAFTLAEQKAILDVLGQLTWGTVEERALVKLCFYFGLRPVQIGMLQRRHLVKYVSPHNVTYLLFVPRVKKGVATEETRPHNIPPELGLGQLLEGLHSPDVPDDRCLFPSLEGLSGKEAKINHMLKAWAHKRGPRPLRTRRILTAEGSPDLLPINPYRFRRTMATNMARQGATDAAIAIELDDDDERMAFVYTENIEQLVDVLGDTLDTGEYFDILGGWFGRFATEEDESLPVVRAVSVDGPRLEGLLDLGGMGRCGAGALCNDLWPMRCYRCNDFGAEPDGPHEAMLAHVDEVIAAERTEGSSRMAEVYKSSRDRIAIAVEAQRRTKAGEANVSLLSLTQ